MLIGKVKRRSTFNKHMNRKVFFLPALILMMAGCGGDDLSQVTNAERVPVQVHLSGFTVTHEDISKTRAAQSVADYSGVKILYLLFFDATTGTEVCRYVQDKNEPTSYTNFGEFACQLPLGSYTLVVIGRGSGTGDEFAIVSPTEAGYNSERARETLTYTQQVVIDKVKPMDLDVELKRIVARVQVVATDNAVANFAKVRTTYSAGGKRFNPTTGQALSNTGFSVVNNPSLNTGKPVDVASYVFLQTDEQTMDITIEMLDANNQVLLKKVAKGIVLKRNRTTKLTGSLFSGEADMQIKVEDWLENNEVQI